MKKFGRWLVLGLVLAFLLKTLLDRAAEVATLRLTIQGWGWLALSLGLTAAAHLWSAVVWGWLLQAFGRSAPRGWVLRTYLVTNVAKYLPGNVWHFYGRIRAAGRVGVAWPVAAASVLLEPLLMAVAALLLGVLASDRAWWGVQLALAIGVLAAVHPRILNPLLQRLGRRKLQTTDSNPHHQPAQLSQYPIGPLLGETGFLLWRGAGFLAALAAFSAINPLDLPRLASGFGLAWLLGLVVPGAPGGVGVFEAAAIALLGSIVNPAALLASVASYRLVSVLAETGLGGLAWWLTPPAEQIWPGESESRESEASESN